MDTNLNISISSESVEIISTGSVIQFKNENIVFHIEDLKFVLVFKKDGGKSRIDTVISDDESEMEIIFYNCDNNFGIGTTGPLDLAEVNGRKVYFMARVSTLGKEKLSRLVYYTWYLERTK